MSDDNVIVASFAKNHRERIVIALGSFKGHDTADVRVFVGDGPDAVPTRKGLTVRRELLPDLAAALVAAVKAAGLTVSDEAQDAR
jgi:hypothetical protein